MAIVNELLSSPGVGQCWLWPARRHTAATADNSPSLLLLMPWLMPPFPRTERGGGGAGYLAMSPWLERVVVVELWERKG